jgi:hypothetical protein
MDNNFLMTSPKPVGLRPRCVMSELVVSVRVIDEFGNANYVTATTDAAHTDSKEVGNLISLKPNEVTRLAAMSAKGLLEQIAERYRLP